MADVIIINKVDSAPKANVKLILGNIKKYNPKAKVIKAKSVIEVDKPFLIKKKNVLVVEDGPTLTHGGMNFGAGVVAAKKYKAKIINAKKFAFGSIKGVYENYKHLKNVLPAMGYGKQQVKDLEKTINRAKCDAVIDASPVNISKLIKVNKPIANVTYSLDEIGHPNLETILNAFLKK